MVTFKSLVALTLGAVATATPSVVRRQAAGEPLTCSYVLTPSTTVGSDVILTSEFNYESPSHDTINGSGFTGVDNGDGTFTAVGSVGTSALTAEELKALVTIQHFGLGGGICHLRMRDIISGGNMG
ncbi:hypothetical protein V5O48_015769 [Marasmius crinis-equi]|uniref:Uncharacterized protein n=1 Tax=Marasmius crinis-equi TaxID=585013 RepID=A0ABR3ETL6_9AGAR